DHFEPEAGRVMCGVTLDVRTLEHEPHPTVRQVEAHRHLGVALVRPVAHPHPAAHLRVRVVPVVVAALVEVGRFLDRMEIVVLGFQSDAHVSFLLRTWGFYPPYGGNNYPKLAKGQGVTRILQCASGLARARNASGTPSRSTRPVIIGATSTSPSAMDRRLSANSIGSYPSTNCRLSS